MPLKRYNVSFFQPHVGADAPGALQRGDIFSAFLAESPLLDVESHKYRVVVDQVGRDVFRGELKRFGHDDLPHAGRPEGREDAERELEMAEDEMTIERNHFLYFRRRRVLVWQENRRASFVVQLGRYLSDVLGHTVSLNPIMTAEATRTMMLEEHAPKALEFTVARPLNPAMYDPRDESARIMDLLAGLNALSGSFRISANSQGIRGQLLDAARTIRLGNSLVESGRAKRVRLELEGVDHPIDLIADRLRGRAMVEMRGRYPLAASIYSELDRIYNDSEAELNMILGQ